MKVLHSETHEREGNDSWLIDKIQIIKEDGDVILRHKVNHTGWQGPIKHTREIILDQSSLEKKQARVKEYMENEMLTPDMEIPNLESLIS